MPEVIVDKKVFTLAEVALSVQKTIAERYKSTFWVRAEMNKLNYYSYSGHCYPELVEKKDGKVIAQVKANLWKNDFLSINQKFLQILKEPLKDGIKILFCASVTFDPIYGLCLRIIDIDPSFSLGELEKERQHTIDTLKREGLFDKNKALAFPMVPQRVAVISVETSKGYADFIKVIDNNQWGYRFFYLLFPALLQGERSVLSIRQQLEQIKKVQGHFDVVAIIRGGGGDVGLSSYNNYDLSRDIALFPLPVITGIGHSTNETVTEMVAAFNGITPTELADFLIQKFHNVAVPVERAREKIAEKARRMLKENQQKFFNIARYFSLLTKNSFAGIHYKLENFEERVFQKAKTVLKDENENLNEICAGLEKNAHGILNSSRDNINKSLVTIERDTIGALADQKKQIGHLQKQVEMLDPVNVLRRGYSITLHNGKLVKGDSELETSDILTTILADGTVTSKVLDIQKNTLGKQDKDNSTM